MRPIEKKVTPRSMQRKGYATSHTLLSNLACVVLALVTTALIWLSGAI